MSDKIITYTGKMVDIFNIQPDDICIEDIAHSLSMKCRFNGHMRRFYSVAEHCLRLAGNDYFLEFPGRKDLLLMHDAAEAYLPDMPKPYKNKIPEFQKIEDNILRVIFERFNIKFTNEEWLEVCKSDNAICDLELRLFTNFKEIINISLFTDMRMMNSNLFVKKEFLNFANQLGIV